MSKERHVIALSGGKDSAALAVYLREKSPDVEFEYVFTDSGCELPETYEYLDKIRAMLNIEITVLKPEKGWDDYWTLVKVKETPYGTFTYLPSPKQRWCTEVLKLRPYEKWVKNDATGCIINSYVGLRADEADERKGMIARNPRLKVRFPFVEDGLVLDDVINVLVNSGLGLPGYYSWRKRSGCFFCFYQSKREWMGLYEHHPDLYYKAMEYETNLPEKGVSFTWCQGVSLGKLLEQKDHYHHSEVVAGGIDCLHPSKGRLLKTLNLAGLKGGN